MSTTTEKLPHAEALAIAEKFRNYFDGCAVRWEIAGSLRRNRPVVGDIEHVVIPMYRGNNMNKLWERLDELTDDPESVFPQENAIFRRAIYPNATMRWGDKYRGVTFKGIRHEIFSADFDNWGNILAIRTGPAEFSQMLVTRCQRGGLRQKEGYLVDGNDHRYPCSDEQQFFGLCGVQWKQPHERDISTE